MARQIIMILWLFVIIISYFFFAISVFGDKLLLAGKPDPRSYTFYVGILNTSAFLLLFFVPSIHWPSLPVLGWAFLSGLTTILALYFMFWAVEQFEVSKVMPALGGLMPIFIFLLTQVFFGLRVLSLAGYAAFILLIAGSVFISTETKLSFKPAYIELVTGSAFLFSLAYIFSKMVFLQESFLQGMAMIGLATALMALVLLIDARFRRAIFGKHATFDRQNGVLFLSFQLSGAAAGFLQNWAIALVPVGYLAIMNSIRGVQYVFLFAITLGFSYFFPHIFKEKISKKIVLRKSFSILLIVLGLALLIF